MLTALAVGCRAHRPAQAEPVGAVYRDGTLPARLIDAHFPEADSHYHAIAQASDGNVYYVLDSHQLDAGARMIRYAPSTGEVTMRGDLTDILGYDRTKVINQGKVHSDLFEDDGWLYFGTHCGTYESEGLEPYPGGHYMRYGLRSGTFEDLGIGVPRHGMVAMSMDRQRGRLYMMGWPYAEFGYHDLAAGRSKQLGRSVMFTPEQYRAHQARKPASATPTPAPATAEPADASYETRIKTVQIPRSLGVDPNTGDVYWHNIDGSFVRYNYASDAIEQLPDLRFNAPMFQIPLPENVGPYWRSLRWSDAAQRFYGVMYFSDYLVSFDPKTREIELIDRIAAGPSRRSGRTTYSSLAFELSADGRTVYYIAHDERPAVGNSPGATELHVVTYELARRRYVDHGIIELPDGRRPRYTQGLEIGTDGNLYLVCWVDVTDLESKRGRTLLAALDKPRPAEDQGKPVTEVNLVIVKDPLRK